MELYVPAGPRGGGVVGSGYRIGSGAALTAAHVVATMPVWRADQPVPPDAYVQGVCWARPLGQVEWVLAVVAWRSADQDIAVLRLSSAVPALPEGSARTRWGRLDGKEQIAVSAVGFPWAQERPDGVRDTEQLFGFIAPDTMAKAGRSAVTVLTARPADRAGGSPWAGMSGAALFAGPFLVGVVVADPAGFGTDRVVAAPIAPLVSDPDAAALLGTRADLLTTVGPQLRLAVTAETSVALVPPYRAATARFGREPGRLLLPEYGIVPFAGGEGDLGTLETWCLTGAGPALRVITGAGGSGKTRLAAEMCLRMARRGWQAGFADSRVPGGQPQLEFDRPTLLVVDDADLDVTLLAKLIRTAGSWASEAPPLRVLLLARHVTGWWDTLNQRTDRLASELADPPLTLHDGALAPADRTGHYARAMKAFAAYLPEAVGSGDPAPPPLADPAFANPLLVHMHALLTICGAQVPTTGGEVRERILDALLDRERERWTTTFPGNVPTGGARTRHQSVAAVTLLTPPTETAAAQALAVIAEFAPGAQAGARAAVAAWLHELYPGSEPPWTTPMRPDPLAEQLLASCPQFSSLILACYSNIGTPGQLEQMLTELTRADSRAVVREGLALLLGAHLPDLLTAAVEAPAGRLPDLLDLALTRTPAPAAAATLVDRLPERSTGLAALAATLASQAVDHHRSRAAALADLLAPDLARSLHKLSVRLADLGRREDALAAIEEAVSLRRPLAAADPDAGTADLAASLDNLSSRLADLGRREDALAAIEEAVTFRRPLAAVRPDVFNPDLAMSLNKLSVRLADLGRREDALAAIDEAVTLRRPLAAARPDAFAPDLAASLHNLSSRLAAVGRWNDALAAVEEAVSLRRQLAAARPDAFAPDLAGSLNNLSNRLAELGRHEDALAAIEEAVGVYRPLAAARPERFTPDLAMALNNLPSRLAALDRDEDALAAIEEAVGVYRRLAAARPEPFTPDLAGALNNLSSCLGALDRREDALAAIEEAVGIYRRLAAARPDAFTPDLAGSLNNLSVRLADLGRREDALAAIEEAVGVYRRLAAARPEPFTPDLAMALNNLSVRLADLGRHEDALAAIEEAVGVYRPLAAAGPDVFTADLARTLLTYGSCLTKLSRPHDALVAYREAIALYRRLHVGHPDALRSNFVQALRSLVTDLRSLGAGDEADRADRELAILTSQPGGH
jgi:tetratricopeptide (TPR) repeat protein